MSLQGLVTRRRVIVAVVVLVLLAVAWTAWLAWRTALDLQASDDAARRLQTAVETGDVAGRDAAIADLQESAASAHDRTDGLWWGAMTLVPVYGDDARGVEALSASVDEAASGAVTPLVETEADLDGVVERGRVDLERLTSFQAPVGQAATALRTATTLVTDQDSSGFTGALRTRYDDYAGRVSELADQLDAASTAVDVLPAMLGSEGPRDYLFVFQNNAEIRSTGGLPGSWARIHTEDGRIELRQQGSAGDLGTGNPITRLTDEEVAVYDQLPAIFFQDPNFIPDFPRAAEIFDAFWAERYPRVELDGVLTFDPVGMSYVMAGTGPVQVGDLTLTADNIVAELLSNTYAQIEDPQEQDERFEAAATALFAAATGDLASPLDFVTGLSRAVREGRFLIAPFDEGDARGLEGSAVVGALAGDDGSTPHVDIGVNDGTGSKMSYYLRYGAEVRAESCDGGAQQLAGSMQLTQTVDLATARRLPDYVTGANQFGIPVGSQLVTLRLYGPYGGTITDVEINGEPLEVEEGLMIDGRPVVTVAPIVEPSAPSVVTWSMSTGPGQSGAGVVGVTPGVEPGNQDSTFTSAC